MSDSSRPSRLGQRREANLTIRPLNPVEDNREYLPGVELAVTVFADYDHDRTPDARRHASSPGIR
jgi:hypothetical protein